MIRYENECVGCPPEMGCASSCKYKRVPHMICDVCGDEVDKLFHVDGDDICVKCAKENFSVEELMEALYGTVEV